MRFMYTFSLESKKNPMNLWKIYIGIHHPYEMYTRFFLLWESS